MDHKITSIELQHDLSRVLEQVTNRRARFLITQNGTPSAILLSVSEYEDLQDVCETALEQADPEFQKSLHVARQEIETGQTVSIDDLEADLAEKEQPHRSS